MSDLEAKCFIKKGNALIPADFVADEFMGSIPNGREVLVSVRRARSPRHHRWFFALLRKVLENTDNVWATEEDLLEDLKDAVGHVTRRDNLLTGKPGRPTKSISFAAMPEDPFRRFRDRCLHVLGKYLGWDPVTLMEEVEATQNPVGISSPPTIPIPSRSPSHAHGTRERVDG